MPRALVVIQLLMAAMRVVADDGELDPLQRSRAILSEPGRWVDPSLANPMPEVDAVTTAELRGIASGATSRIDTAPSRPDRPGMHSRLFVSQSMPESELKAALAIARSHPDLVVVLRGVAPEQTLGQLQRRLLALLGSPSIGSPWPAIELDPPRFVAAGILAVPTLLRYDGERELARVAGRIDPDWLSREVSAGRRGDLGTFGEMLPIVEPDLMLALRERFRKWDVGVLRREAESRFWRRSAVSSLPPTVSPRARRIDPSFVVSADLTTPDGQVIAHAGDLVNPLSRVAFTQRLVIFDATDTRQCTQVARLVRSAGERRVTLLTTRWDADLGVDGLAALSRTLGPPIFLLSPEVIQRFHLEHVPSVVEADGLAFVVTELMPGDEG